MLVLLAGVPDFFAEVLVFLAVVLLFLAVVPLLLAGALLLTFDVEVVVVPIFVLAVEFLAEKELATGVVVVCWGLAPEAAL